METITAVKNDAKKIRRSLTKKIKKAAVVTAVGAGAVALCYYASKTAIKNDLDNRKLVFTLVDTDQTDPVTLEATTQE